MTVVRIDGLDDPRLADYRNVPDPALFAERGVLVAEGRLVVRAADAPPVQDPVAARQRRVESEARR